MASKYELTISAEYVKDWGLYQGIRELVQNARDNEAVDPANTMSIDYDKDSNLLVISNATSKLQLDSLLLGSSSKRGDSRTVGVHGEGYKLAIMVLLRERYGVEVINGDELWECRLVKSRRFNNQLVPVITVSKSNMLNRYGSGNLEFRISGVAEYEYSEICENLLMLQDDYESYQTERCSVLTSPQHKGKLFVEGLFICENDELELGYDYKAESVSLDRDRRLISDFDIRYEASQALNNLYSNGKLQDKIIQLVEKGSLDARSIALGYPQSSNLSNGLYSKLFEEDEKAYPVTNSDDYSRAKNLGLTPIVVKENHYEILVKSSSYKSLDELENENEVEDKELSPKERLIVWYDKISSDLDEELVEEFESILEDL